VELTYHGANCVTLSAKKVSVVIDDNLSAIGGKSVSSKAVINIYTQARYNDSKAPGFVIDGPGEYEVSEVSVLGFRKRAHTDHEDEKTATVFRVIIRGVSVVALGHIHGKLSSEQLEKLGTVDVLLVPVGGSGYTLDAKAAATAVKAIEPKIVVPTHYEEKGINFEVPQAPVSDFFKELGVEPQKVDSLKLKASTLPIDTQEVYQLVKT